MYEIRLTQNGVTDSFSHTSASSGADSNNIASGLAALVTANSNYTATQIGLVFISLNSEFSVETRGGSSETAIFALKLFQNTRLPLQSKNGYVVSHQ